MKTLKTLLPIALVGMAFFWTACKKDVAQPAIQQPQSQSNQPRYGGVREDDPQSVAKVSFIISSNLLASGQGSSSVERGRLPKPIKGGTPDITPPAVNIMTPGQGQ